MIMSCWMVGGAIPLCGQHSEEVVSTNVTFLMPIDVPYLYNGESNLFRVMFQKLVRAVHAHQYIFIQPANGMEIEQYLLVCSRTRIRGW